MNVVHETRARVVVGWLFAALLTGAVCARLAPTIATIAFQPGADEGWYRYFMQRAAADGASVLPELTREWLADPATHIFPNPSRAGFILLSAAWSKLFGQGFEALAYLSLASHAALVLVQFGFARRRFGTPAAAAIALLTATSPLLLGLSRRALTDSFLTLCQVSSLWLFLECVAAPRALGRQLAFVALFALAILTKEITGLLGAPLALFAWIERRRGGELTLPRTALLLVAPVALTIAVWLVACGGVTPTLELLRIVLTSPATNEYALRFGSGPWYRYPIDELLMSPWTSALGLAGVVLALWRWRRGEHDAATVLMALVYVGQVAALAPFTKNLRYVAVLETPLRVCAVVLLLELFSAARAPRLRWAAAVLVALLGWRDFRGYQRDFERDGLYDPMTATLLQLRGVSGPGR